MARSQATRKEWALVGRQASCDRVAVRGTVEVGWEASSEASNGLRHMNNDRIVVKTAENAVGRIPSIRLRDTETCANGWRL